MFSISGGNTPLKLYQCGNSLVTVSMKHPTYSLLPVQNKIENLLELTQTYRKTMNCKTKLLYPNVTYRGRLMLYTYDLLFRLIEQETSFLSAFEIHKKNENCIQYS